VEPGAKCVVFGLGGIGLNVIQGLRLAGADMIIGVDVNNGKKEWGERFGMTHFVNPKEVGSDLVAHLVNMTKRGADPRPYDRTRKAKAEFLESPHHGVGAALSLK
jgi:S-(hydroxymethyl)glutathione dehydrogenase / alcohol dehydrogenase